MKQILQVARDHWELIPAYGLPVFFFTAAVASRDFWTTIILLAYAVFSLWATYIWLLIAAIRWENKWDLLWFTPPVFLGLYIFIMSVIL